MRSAAVTLLGCGLVMQLAWAATGPVQVLGLLGLAVMACGAAVWDD